MVTDSRLGEHLQWKMLSADLVGGNKPPDTSFISFVLFLHF
jgi:hypothetical protein